MRILGIDPGSSRMGYGVIEETPAGVTLIAYGVLENKERELQAKLMSLSQALKTLLIKHSPDLVGIEKLFFSKNRKTALEVAHARGVIVAQLAGAGLLVREFSPGEIKQAVTGYGAADKEMVRKMVCKILGKDELKGLDDAIDAIAAALTASQYEKINRFS